MLLASGALPDDHPLYAPGLKRRERVGAHARYFVVPAKDAKAGYPLKTMTIPANATELEAAELCRKYWGELVAWRAGNDEAPTAYTFAWLIDRYLNDPDSPFRNVREKTRRSYEQNCKIIRATIGKRHLDPVRENGAERPRVVGTDVLRWHKMWGLQAPVMGADGKQLVDPWGNLVTEATAPSRARHLIVMLRILAKYNVMIATPGCLYFRDLLSEMEFPVPKARTVSADRAQVEAFVKQAVADGYLSQAITTLAQFELIERRVHIIGYFEAKQWRPGWVWQNIDWCGPNATWKIRYYQSKVGLVLREFDLKQTPELLALLQQIPEEHRVGPVITMERQRKPGARLPWEERYYAEVWREIARRAGLPDTIQSMDMRASGATEADATPGVSDRALQDAGGWRDPSTPQRYRRQKQRNAGEVVEMRQANRTPKERS